MDLKKYVADIPNFPKEGILFRDITPLMNDGEAYKYATRFNAPIAMLDKRRLGNSQETLIENIVGDVTGKRCVIFDDEALGWNITEESVDPTPYVADGKYWNLWYSFICRTMQDNTEKGVVFLLE